MIFFMTDNVSTNSVINNKNKKKKLIIIITCSVLLVLLAVGGFILYEILKPGWKEDDLGFKYKSEETGEFLTGMQEIDGNLYFFSDDTYVNFGWIENENLKYYALSDATLVKGKYEVDSVMYHFDEENGALLIGFIDDEGSTYYYDENSELVKGYKIIDSKAYFFDDEAKQYVGFETVDGTKKLFLKEGTIPGETSYENETYYINENYDLLLGLQNIEGSLYYFDDATGKRIDGFKTVTEENPDAIPVSEEMAQSEEVLTEGETEEAAESETEEAAEGETTEEVPVIPATIDITYYFSPEDGKALSGWQTINELHYYFSENFTMQKGFVQLEDGYYLLSDETGERLSGWYSNESGRYYFSPETGLAVSGWNNIDGTDYYFSSACTTVGGALTVDGKSFYFSDGVPQYGWVDHSGARYYYLSGGGTHSGQATVNGVSYYFLSNGSLANGWVTIGGVQYYYHNNQKVTEPFNINGITHYFNSDGTITTGWQTIDGNKYYKNSYGAVITGWQTIGGSRYYFDGNGVMAVNTVIGLYAIDGNGVATKQPANSSNIYTYAQELLNQYGWSAGGACNAVRNTVYYRAMGSYGGVVDNAVEAINSGRGACYQFASLAYILFQQMGYDVRYVVGTGRVGPTEHAWIAVNEGDGQWGYYDPMYSSSRLSEETLISYGYTWAPLS